MEKNLHKPVLIDKILENLPDENLTIFDGTFGGGGYSFAFLNKGNTVFACDKDPSVKPSQGLNDNKNFHFQTTGFLDSIRGYEDNFFDLIILDLGFSSNQLEYSGRGFSYLKANEPLDLRYNFEKGIPCYEKIQKIKDTLTLQKILFRYSGESLSKKIAETLLALTKSKKNDQVVTVGETTQAISEIIPNKIKRKTNSILSRVWQALRIWINDEFVELEGFLQASIKKLKPGGLLMIVSFHSLEDKIVAQFMRQKSKPVELDVYGNTNIKYELLSKKAITPTEEEILDNPRSRSSMLRILKKV